MKRLGGRMSTLAAALAAALLAACNGDSTGSTTPAQVQASAGDAQNADAGTALPGPLVVRVTDSRGRGVPGQAVSFVVVSGGGSVSPASAVTDSAGEARTTWTLGPAAGQQQVEARVAGDGSALAAAFTATAVEPPAISKVSGDGQSFIIGTTSKTPLVVEVKRGTAPAAGITVTWAAAAGSGTVQPATSVTDAQGRASATWTAPATPSNGTVTASISPTKSVTFTGTFTPGVVLRVDIINAPDSAYAGFVIGDSLHARVTDQFGTVKSGVTVNWIAFVVGTSLSPQVTPTNAQGIAMTQWKLAPQLGSQGVYATVGTVGGFVADTVYVRAVTAPQRTPASISILPLPASAPTGSLVPVKARVLDAGGLPVVGATVSFLVEAGGGALYSSTAVTGADGVASVYWQLGGLGTQRVRAVVAGVPATTAEMQTTPRVTISGLPDTVAVNPATTFINHTLQLQFTASSTGGDVAEASATVQGRTFTLTCNNSTHQCSGAVVFSDSMATGVYPVTITVRDVIGTTGTATVQAKWRAYPLLTVTNPQPNSVHSDTMTVEATCAYYGQGTESCANYSWGVTLGSFSGGGTGGVLKLLVPLPNETATRNLTVTVYAPGGNLPSPLAQKVIPIQIVPPGSFRAAPR